MAQARIAAGGGDAQDHALVAQAALASTSLRGSRVPLSEMVVSKPAPIDMVLDGLPVGSLGVVLGQGGIGKSIAMLQIAHAVALGTDTLGCLLSKSRHAHHGRVVVLAGEDGRNIIHHRLYAFAHSFPQATIATMDERIDIFPLVGSAPTLMDAAGNLDDAALVIIRGYAKGARLLIIDPLRQFHAGNENDNGMMTVLIKALTQIAHEESCSIILVHHISRNGAKDEDGDANMSRGATAITDNARWVLALRKASDRAIKEFGLDLPSWRYVGVRRVKSNYAALGDVTLLTRGDGGILKPTEAAPRDALRSVVEQCGGTIEEATLSQQRPLLPRTAADLLSLGGGDDAA